MIAHQTVLLFSKPEGKVSTRNPAGEQGAVEGFIRWSLAQAKFGTLDSTGLETC